jgi:glycerol-3-phosphate dehydrogenase (NAD(P)+)
MPDPRPLNFAVIGAGAWGTAMAVHLARRGQHTTLVARRPEHAVQLQAVRENHDYLPGIPLPDGLLIATDLRAALLETDVALIACPSQSLRAWCEQMRAVLHDTSRLQLFLSLVKGLEIGTHLRPSEVMGQVLPGLNCGTLTGPTNAGEVARGLPAAMVMAAQRADEFVPKVQAAMSGTTLRIYTSDDLAGAEYGASLKNIYAIAAGLCDGQKLGDNAKAALLTRAVTEMLRVGVALGARARHLLRPEWLRRSRRHQPRQLEPQSRVRREDWRGQVRRRAPCRPQDGRRGAPQHRGPPRALSGARHHGTDSRRGIRHPLSGQEAG